MAVATAMTRTVRGLLLRSAKPAAATQATTAGTSPAELRSAAKRRMAGERQDHGAPDVSRACCRNFRPVRLPSARQALPRILQDNQHSEDAKDRAQEHWEVAGSHTPQLADLVGPGRREHRGAECEERQTRFHAPDTFQPLTRSPVGSWNARSEAWSGVQSPQANTRVPHWSDSPNTGPGRNWLPATISHRSPAPEQSRMLKNHINQLDAPTVPTACFGRFALRAPMSPIQPGGCISGFIRTGATANIGMTQSNVEVAFESLTSGLEPRAFRCPPSTATRVRTQERCFRKKAIVRFQASVAASSE